MLRGGQGCLLNDSLSSVQRRRVWQSSQVQPQRTTRRAAAYRCRELRVGLQQRPRHPIGCLEPGCLAQHPVPCLATAAILAHPILGRSPTVELRHAGRHKPISTSQNHGFCARPEYEVTHLLLAQNTPTRFNVSRPLRHALHVQLATGEAWGQRGLATESQHPGGTLGIAETPAAPPRIPPTSALCFGDDVPSPQQPGPELQNRHGTHYRHASMP